MSFRNYLLALCVIFIFLGNAVAQQKSATVQRGTPLKTVKSRIVYTKSVNTSAGVNNVKEEEEDRDDLKQGPIITHRPPMHLPDPVWQKQQSTFAPNTFSILHQFDVFPFVSVTPPDPSGDVGTDRVVTSANGPSASGGTRLAVYDKSGNVINPLITFNSLGTQTGGGGDPVIIFDNTVNRWFVLEMSVNPRQLRVYVSQTSNPIGAYFEYVFATPASAQNFPDYPKVGIWNDKYIVTTNEARVTPASSSDPARNVYIMDKNAMITGAAVTPIAFWTDRPSGFSLQNTLPADIDGTLMPAAGSKAVLFRHRDDEINGGTPDPTKDFIEYWELDINFTNPGASVMSGPVRIDVSEFDSNVCSLGIVGCIPQPGTTTRLHAINQMLMYRAQYRRFPTHESIVMNWVTDVNGADLAGVRWSEIRRTTGSWFLYQEGTYAPNDGLNRWMGTIAQDKFGNIALGFAVSSGTKFPSLRITGRKVTDPLGQMTEPETEVGTGTNSSTASRWGDYFHMAVDPVTDEDFWLNGMYSTGNISWRTRVVHFKFNNCLNPFNSTASTTQNVTCFNGTDGIITVTPNGGTSPFTYQLNGGTAQSSNVFNNLAAGTYTITVNDNTGCTSIASATVSQPLQITINETIQPVLCNGAANGTITVTAANTVGAVTYQLNSGTAQSSNVFNNLAAGTYTVTVKDGNNCTVQKTITVTQPAALTAGSSKTDVSCFGGNNGSVSIAAGGGTGTLQYKLNNGSFQTSNTFNNLAAGDYTVTINDANNCSITRTITVTQPAALTNTPSIVNAKCFGESTGRITVAASGGQGAYQYKIGAAGALQTSNVFNNIAAGSYTVFVVDGNNCTTSQTITVSQPSLLTGTVNAVNPSPSNNFKGTISAVVTGGTPPYQYALNNGALQDSGNFTNRYIIGNNTITVTDVNGCVFTSAKLVELNVNNDTWKSFSKVYPNPNQGNFYLEVKGLQTDNNIQVQIFDAKGAQVSKFETGLVNNGIFIRQLNLGNLNGGVYIMKLVSKKTGDKLNIKFIVNQK